MTTGTQAQSDFNLWETNEPPIADSRLIAAELAKGGDNPMRDMRYLKCAVRHCAWRS